MKKGEILAFAERSMAEAERNGAWADVRYWAAYIEGAKAQKREDEDNDFGTP